jgi:hypothetical protein
MIIEELLLRRRSYIAPLPHSPRLGGWKKPNRPNRIGTLVVPVERIELPTFGLQNRCSTAELNRLRH